MTHLPAIHSFYIHLNISYILFRRKNLCSPSADSIHNVLYVVADVHVSQTPRKLIATQPDVCQIDTTN